MHAQKIDPRLLTGLILTLSGLSFWFFLGFPFANHNESFVIVCGLETSSFLDVLTKRIYPVANVRPLGLGVAWLLYQAFGRTIAPVQIFNFVGAAIAWALVCRTVRQKITYGVVGLLSGGVLFAGYIFLFHLHGVFYSPLLILVAAIIVTAERGADKRSFFLLAVWSWIVALFHPYALFVYGAYLLGFFASKGFAGTRGRDWWPILAGSLGTVVLTVVLVLIPRQGTAFTTAEMISGVWATYRMIEVNNIVALISLLFAVATLWSMPISTRLRSILTVVLLALTAGALWLHVPVLYLWFVLCGVKAVILRKPTLLFLMFVTFLFPAPAASGSPTYGIFLLLVCSFVTVDGWEVAEEWLSRLQPRSIVLLPILLVFIIVVLRLGVQIPILSTLASPLLAEKERTVQMEEMMAWFLKSPYADRHLRFFRVSANPSVASDAIDRRHRPPTGQEYLEQHLLCRGQTPGSQSGILYATFGDDTSGVTGQIVFSSHAPHAGAAYVVDPGMPPDATRP